MKDKKEIFQWIGISLIILLFFAITGVSLYSLILQAEGKIPPAPTLPEQGYFFFDKTVLNQHTNTATVTKIHFLTL